MQYALYNDPRRPGIKEEEDEQEDASQSRDNLWVSRLRIPQELLDQLLALEPTRKRVTFQLVRPHAIGGPKPQSSSSSSSSSALLSIWDIETQEIDSQFELLCFEEDPAVNHVLAFRVDDSSQQVPPSAAASSQSLTPSVAPSEPSEPPKTPGFALFRVGHVHQKLMVQRQLTSVEKDRLKDRHSNAVIESKARASKLIDVTCSLSGSARAKRVARVVQKDAWNVPAKHQKHNEMLHVADELPPSALTAEQAQAIRERIEQEARPKPTLAEPKPATIEAAEPPPALGGACKIQKPLKSDKSKPLKPDNSQKKRSAIQLQQSEPVPTAPTTVFSAASQPTKLHQPVSASYSDPEEQLPPPLGGGDGQEHKRLKRARPRTLHTPTTGSSTFTKQHLPDLSFLPANAQATLQRVMTSRCIRTSILDAQDLEHFQSQLACARDDWFLLDRACSLAMLRLQQTQLQQQEGCPTPTPTPTSTQAAQTTKTQTEPEQQERHKDNVVDVGIVNRGVAWMMEWMGTLEREMELLESCLLRYRHKHKVSTT